MNIPSAEPPYRPRTIAVLQRGSLQERRRKSEFEVIDRKPACSTASGTTPSCPADLYQLFLTISDAVEPAAFAGFDSKRTPEKVLRRGKGL